MKSCSASDSDYVIEDTAAGVSAAFAYVGGFILFAFIFLCIGIRDFIVSFGSIAGIIDFVASLFAVVLTLYAGYCAVNQSMARYEVQKDGILIKYLFPQKPVFIPWTEFQEVCICYADISPMRQNTVICCVRHGERRGWNGRWKTDSIFHYRGVIRIAYSENRLREFEDTYPLSIVDRRNNHTR